MMAQETKWTPGKWEPWLSPDKKIWTVRSVYQDVHGRRNTAWPAVCNAGAQDNEANAHLISAAPDMYSSMNPEILEAAAALLLECEKYETARSLLHVAEEQRAAQAKARGES